MKYQVVRISARTAGQHIIGTFESLPYAEIMKRAYVNIKKLTPQLCNDTVKIIIVEDNYKNDITKAYENAVYEYHRYLNSENYDTITASKFSNIVETLNNLVDYINYEF